MLESQKLTLELSKAREQRDNFTASINKAVGSGEEPKTDDLANLDKAGEAIKGLEIRFRSALTKESEETRQAGDGGGDVEQRERIALRSKASLGKYISAALSGRQIDGPEAELRSAAGVPEGIPLELWDTPRPETRGRTENRVDAATEAPTTVGVNYQQTLPSIFARSVLPRIGFQMPMVQSGSAAWAVLSTDLSAGAKAKGSPQESTEAAFTTATRTPKRISARLSIQMEDLAAVGLPGFEEQLRTNLSLALSDQIDKQGLTGNGTAPNLQGFVSDITDATTGSTVVDFKAFVKACADGVDGGPWSESLSDVILLCNAETMRLAEATFQSGSSGFTTAVSAASYLRANARGFMASSRMPATPNSNISQNLRIRLGTMGLDGVDAPMVGAMPVWNSISIDDIYSDSASATRHFSVHILVSDPVVLYSNAFEKVALKLA